MRAAAVFLDRDGTLIEDVGYPADPDQVRVLPGVAEALRQLRQAGFRLVIVSNQSGVGRGLITPVQAEAVHRRVISELSRRQVRIDAYRYCPHSPEAGCACRKPEPTMLLEAADQLHLDLHSSFMVGDRESDTEAGHRAGCRTVLLGSGSAAAAADYVAADWAEALAYIEAAAVAA